MKLIFLTGWNGDIIALNPEIVGHIDSYGDKGKIIIGQSLVYTTNGLQLRLKGSVKEIACQIIKQLEEITI